MADSDKILFDRRSARRIDQTVRGWEAQPYDRTLQRSRVGDVTLKITANAGKTGCYTAVEILPPLTAINISSGDLSLADIGRVLPAPQTVYVLNPYEVGLGSHVLVAGDVVSAEPHGVTTTGKRLFKVRNCLSAGDCGGS